MLRKLIRNTIFSLLHHSPAVIRDYFFRSRLNIPPLPQDIVFDIATSRQDLDQAFHLLHDAYVREGYSKPHVSRRRITDYHALPSTTTLVARVRGEVVATVSIIRDGHFGLPADSVVDLSSYRGNYERLGEVSSLAIKPDFRGRSGEVMFYLFKYLYHYSTKYFGLDRFVIVVNPNRITLYESIILFVPLHRSAIKTYGFANNAPAVCATLDLQTAPQRWRKAYESKPAKKNIYRFFTDPLSRKEKRQMRFPERPFFTAMDPVMTPDVMDYFYNRCSDGMCRLEDRQVGILKSIYSDEEYSPIWPPLNNRNWKNKRSHRRFDVDCPGHLQHLTKGNVSIQIVDASRNGIRVRTSEPIDPDSDVTLNISVGRKKSAFVRARLRWQSGVACGMEIVRASHLWNEFIDYLESQISMLDRNQEMAAVG